MKMSTILKSKIPLAVAALIIMAAGVFTEKIFLAAADTSVKADNYALTISLSSGQRQAIVAQNSAKETIALAEADVPLMAGAKRLTFGDSHSVSYRVNASAEAVAAFYRQTLTGQNRGTAAKMDRLTISFVENPLSNKTDITYTYAPANGTKVLGVKIAEADPSAPAPTEPAQQPQPQQPAPDQNQPNQPMPNGQPQPMQQFNQPNTNQMEFSRPMQPFSDGQQGGQTCRVNGVETPGPCGQNNNKNQGQNQQNQNNQQYQPWADMCSNNTELACVDGAGKFVASAKVGSDGKPVCPADSSAQCGNYQQNNQQGRNGQGGRGQGGQYNNQNQGQRGQEGQMGQPGQQGPSEEDMKKMDEQRFKDMKRGLSQFSNGAKMMKKSIARVKTAISKCGVGMPEELVNALAQTDSITEKINAAQTADELDEIVGDIQDVGSVMQDWGPRMGDLSRLCQTLKQADRDAKQFDRSIKQMESQAKSNKKIDLSELIAEYKTAVAAQKDILAQAKELAKTDPDSALAKIQDDFYGNMDNLGNLQMQINTVFNISKGIKNITRELTTFASQIKALTKKKVDTAAMQEMLDNLKAQVEEIKNLVKGKVDAEELAAKVDDAFATRQELQDALQESGVINMMPQTNSGSNYNVKVNLPDAFMKSDNSGDNGPGFDANAPAGLGL